MIILRKGLSSSSPKWFGPNKKKSFKRFNLIHSSFSSKKLSRQFPFVSGMHRAVDGALIGVIISVALMSTLALHWRHLWIVAFTRLESTRDLSHRLIDSTAMLERNLLTTTSLPVKFVPTKAEDLMYVDKPFSVINSRRRTDNVNNIFQYPVHKGY